MNAADAIQAGAFVLIMALLVKPVGAYLERVFERRHTFFDPLLLPAERLIHRLVGIDPKCEMDWKRYAFAFTLFGVINIVTVYFLLRCQALLLRPVPNVMTTPMKPDLAANTTVSFATTPTSEAVLGQKTVKSPSRRVQSV